MKVVSQHQYRRFLLLYAEGQISKSQCLEALDVDKDALPKKVKR